MFINCSDLLIDGGNLLINCGDFLGSVVLIGDDIQMAGT